MAQVFEWSNRETEPGDESKGTSNRPNTWELALGDLDAQPTEETDSQTVNLLYMLSSLGFVTFKDFEEHFSTCFVELRTTSQIEVFKANFFALLAAIQQICLEKLSAKTNETLCSMRFNSFMDKCELSKTQPGPSFFETNSNQISISPFVQQAAES